MKHYHTSTSLEGLRLPYSGFIVGKLAEALRLKAMLREDFEVVSYKTVQRYFSGERINPSTVEEILDALVDSLVPGEFVLGKGLPFEFPLGLVVRSALKNYAAHWDRMASQANVHMFEVNNPQDLPMPVLRLVALDMGIRVGGWAALRYLKNDPIPWDDIPWFTGGWFSHYLDQRRRVLGLTVSRLAEAVDVSDQAVEAWRSGSSLPTNNHIEALSKALAGDDLRRVEVEYTLRVSVAVKQVLSDLKAVLGERRLEDLLNAIKATAQEIENFQRLAFSIGPPPELPLPLMSKWDEIKEGLKRDALRGALWELPVHGARCPIGEVTAEGLAEKAKWRPEGAADFAVLSGDWSPRITYWLSHIGSADREVEFLSNYLSRPDGGSQEHGEMIARAVVESKLGFGNLFYEPSPDMHVVEYEPPPFGKAMNRLSQAQVAGSVGDMDTSIEHLRHAVQHQPEDAYLHFSLGAALWQAALKVEDLETVEEGLLECRIAVQLDPAFGNARNEIGVILSNLQRHEEAEQAFSEAEPYNGQHNHHWFCRGTNYLALGRLEDARLAFEKAIELTGKGQHVMAKARLAATLMALGKKREARNLGKQVQYVAGFDPTEDWERGIDPWGNAPTPGKRIRHKKIGRNERCPCGSGKKYKRCCGR